MPDRGDPSWTDPTCPVARAVDLVGDRWSLLIIRDAMDGATAFTEFQRRTGIARNVLTDRLGRLVNDGVLERRTAPSGKRQHYTLTPAGRDLFTVILALRQWGEAHAFDADEPHSVLLDANGAELPVLRAVDRNGDPADVETTSVRHVP